MALTRSCLAWWVLGPAAAIAGTLSLDCESPDALGPAGATAVGTVTTAPGRRGQGLRLANAAYIRLPTKTAFRPDAGSISLWAKPEWDGRDSQRHTFFHVGGGHAHVTLFTSGGGKLLFVYKGNQRSWRGVSLNIAGWTRGAWRHLQAAWQQQPSGDVAFWVAADGQWTAAGGGVVLPSTPSHLCLGGREAREPANAVIDDVVISTEFSLPKLSPAGETTIPVRVDARRPAGPVPRVWSFVTPWNSRTYRVPFTRSHPYFKRFKEAGFGMVRMVAFSENWLWGTEVTRGPDGKLKLDFTDFDTMVDMYRAAGAEPYIRLAYHMPKVLSSSTASHYHPPRDMGEWRDFVKRIVRHCNVERGLGIRYWVTMLNEADIPIRKGQVTWEPVLDLYEQTTRAARSVDPSIKVGGPATCGPLPGAQEEAIKRFVGFCKQKGLPPDFICFHAYRRPEPKDYETAVLAAKAAVESVWPEIRPEYFLDEWNLWARDQTQDNEYGAAYIASAVHYQMRAGLTRSSIVSFNTHFPPDEITGNGQVFTGPFRKAPGRTARFYSAEAKVAGKTRGCLYTHAPPPGDTPGGAYTFGRFTVPVPRDAYLCTGAALAFPYEGADGVGMEIRITDGDRETTLLRHHVTRAAWEEHRLSLAKFAGREVAIEFRTDCGPANRDVSADHGLWGDPHIEAAGQRAYEFLPHLDQATTGWRVSREWHRLGTKLPMIKGYVVTPIYFTYWLMNRLQGQRLTAELAGRDGIHGSNTVGAIACRDHDAVRILLWHFDGPRAQLGQHFAGPGIGLERTVRLRIEGLDGPRRVRQFLIDHDHSNAYTDYVLRGKPNNRGRYNLETGEVEVVLDERRQAEGGAIRLDLALRNMSVSLVEIDRP